MRDVLLVRGVECIADLHGVAQRLISSGKRTMERSPLDKLHDQIVGADIVKLANVWMVQRGDGFGFMFEALTELRGGNLDGDVTVQTGVTGAVHLAHATGADGRKDLIWAEFCSRQKRHLCDAA